MVSAMEGTASVPLLLPPTHVVDLGPHMFRICVRLLGIFFDQFLEIYF